MAATYIALLAACVIGVMLESRQRPPERMRIALLGSPADEDYAGASALKAHIETHTEGAISVEIYHSGQFCANPRECIGHMRSGALDVFMTTFGGLATVHPPAQAFDLPYLFDNDAVAECVLDGDMVSVLRREVLAADLGLRLMVIGNTGGWRNFATTRRPIRTAADLKGLKIRTTAAPIGQALVVRLGANPTPVAWSEVYAALATGVVDGAKNSVQDIVSMRLEEQIKHIVLDRHGYMGAAWWYSERRWSALSPERRRVVEEGFASLRDVTRATPKRMAEDAYAAFRAAGGAVYVPSIEEKATFKTAARGMRQWYRARHGEAWLTRLDAAIETCSASRTD
ncbi:MAG: TRAP transporter substrate-binding protein DctP [Pseudomonadota bacterium]